MSDGYYYLHTNGDLIWKRYLGDIDPDQEADFRESPFVKKYWRINLKDRGSAWLIAIEAAALGARKDRVDDLVKNWGLTDEDAETFAAHAGLHLDRDGSMWMAAFEDFVDIQESQCGFGDTAFNAFVELVELGEVYINCAIEKIAKALKEVK